MKVGALATMMAALLIGGFSLSAQAGPVGTDIDSDGTLDQNDFCSTNPTAPTPCGLDTDNDGYGNACDGDFNNDGASDFLDVAPFAAFLGGGVSSPADMNCDGATDFLDVTPFAAQLGAGAPGPSGLPCAGTIPCP